MRSSGKPRWQQATALVSLSTAGAVTGLSFAHGTPADLTSPSRVPVKLTASVTAAGSSSASDAALRAAIVKSAQHYLHLAQSRSPSQMEALIWQGDSLDGADHGESCAAFASLTLEAGAQAAGQQSWVSGGSTYPWPMHDWADARVDANPDSMNIISVVQDAQAHHRWHAVGSGYAPQPGDWVLFHGHVEVVTRYSGGVLSTIGGDSLPNFSVNAHQYDGSLAAAGVTGFVNNGGLASAGGQAATQTASIAQGAGPGSAAGQQASAQEQAAVQGQANVPGLVAPAMSLGGSAGGQGSVRQAVSQQGQAQQSQSQARTQSQSAPAAAGGSAAEVTVAGAASIPGSSPVSGSVTSYSAAAGTASAGASTSAGASASAATTASAAARYSRTQPDAAASGGADTAAQQAFISSVAPGAIAAQQRYGVPAAVTIAQAIDESGWGQSKLAAQDNNLFGIKGTGPAGSVLRPTQEYQNGQAVTISAPFRVYADVAQSISDHGLLLATGSSYKQAMADRRSPDAFANDLTGVYATDPNYGASLITLMRQYNLYRFDASTAQASSATASSGIAATQNGSSAQKAGASGSGGTGSAGPGSAGSGSPVSGSAAGSGSGSGGSAQAGVAEDAAIPGAVQPDAVTLGMAAHQAGGTATKQAAGGSRSSGGSSSASVKAGAVAGQAGSGTAKAGNGTAKAGNGTAKAGSGTARAGTPAAGSVTGPGQGSANIPGVLDGSAGVAAVGGLAIGGRRRAEARSALRAGPRTARVSLRRYVPEVPRTVMTDFVASAKTPLLRAKPIYQEVGSLHGLRWELLAACDWMQCEARPDVSPVYGEPIGTRNPDGTAYRSKADALDQVAGDLVELAAAVYGIDLRQRLILTIQELASVFAAFRWGGLLKSHQVSAMQFPYSVEGLTSHHLKMRWPEIPDRAPDKPGTRFRRPFGAVPVVLGLNYPVITTG